MDYEKLWKTLEEQINEDIKELKDEYERGYAVSRGYRSALYVVKDYMTTLKKVSRDIDSGEFDGDLKDFKK